MPNAKAIERIEEKQSYICFKVWFEGSNCHMICLFVSEALVVVHFHAAFHQVQATTRAVNDNSRQ